MRITDNYRLRQFSELDGQKKMEIQISSKGCEIDFVAKLWIYIMLLH